MRFRQVHLDFHTSEAVAGIGASFSKEQFQHMLQVGHVDSITIFAKCHHGWAYHPTKANEMHPHLKFDLLAAQIEAAHEINVKTPVYLSAGLDEKIARKYPQWLIRNKEDKTNWVPDFMTAGYHQFCMNSPYLDVLIAQIEEVVTNYDADGIFLDIVGVRECYCQNCISSIQQRGADPRDLEQMKKLWEDTYANYTKRVEEATHAIKPDMPIFHNSGHITRGRRDLAHMNSHLELESLPTGGWGYDHFPLSARYAQTLGMDYLGMTGKFHTTWGEFGGYKHPNALRYETALSLANGAKCSIGDQLHPNGLMDNATYTLIGAAYKEVAEKEAWCDQVKAVTDVAVLSVESITGDSDDRQNLADVGATRILLEGHYLFDIVDMEADLTKYQVLILPDNIPNSPEIVAKIQQFVQQGGKLLVTGKSLLDKETGQFAADLGVEWKQQVVSSPSYFRPAFTLQSLQTAAFVMYSEAQDVALTTTGTSLGNREDSYFNRDVYHFFSHQHAPSTTEAAGIGIAEGNDGIYIAWDIFAEYADKGSLHVKEIVVYALEQLLENKRMTTNLPAQAITTLQQQPEQQRYVHHVLYGSPVKRGKNIEVIEDLPVQYNTTVTVAVAQSVKEVYLAPQQEAIEFTIDAGKVTYTIPSWSCHQMVVIAYE